MGVVDIKARYMSQHPHRAQSVSDAADTTEGSDISSLSSDASSILGRGLMSPSAARHRRSGDSDGPYSLSELPPKSISSVSGPPSSPTAVVRPSVLDCHDSGGAKGCPEAEFNAASAGTPPLPSPLYLTHWVSEEVAEYSVVPPAPPEPQEEGRRSMRRRAPRIHFDPSRATPRHTAASNDREDIPPSSPLRSNRPRFQYAPYISPRRGNRRSPSPANSLDEIFNDMGVDEDDRTDGEDSDGDDVGSSPRDGVPGKPKRPGRRMPPHERPKGTFDGKVWVCNLDGCTSTFPREGDLKRHQRTSKAHAISQFFCECGSTFTRADGLKRHLHTSQHKPGKGSLPPNGSTYPALPPPYAGSRGRDHYSRNSAPSLSTESLPPRCRSCNRAIPDSAELGKHEQECYFSRASVSPSSSRTELSHRHNARSHHVTAAYNLKGGDSSGSPPFYPPTHKNT